jgi:integrase
MKIDPYHHKERYLKWKEKVKDGIPETSEINSKLILKYLYDMEKGLNVGIAGGKGSRSYNRLNCLKDKMLFFCRKFKSVYGIDNILEIPEDRLIEFFSDMKNGHLKKDNKQDYKATDSFVRVYRAFWHWWMKVNQKQGREIKDITNELETDAEKPDWVYMSEEQIKKLCENAKYEYRVLIMFLFDTGIRAPTELVNVKVSDLYNNCKELQIREETSKTFGRRIKLMISSELIKDYIKNKNLQQEDYLFKVSPAIVNKYLKRLSKRVFGDKESSAGAKYSELTMYDFRHNSCCYWLPRYKSESALKYRFGWKRSDKIHYYSELLGMKDTISQEDMLIDVTKTDIEKELEKTKRENTLIRDEMTNMQNQMSKILELVSRIGVRIETAHE